MPKPEVLVDYYRSLVERSEGFKIEGDPSGGNSDNGKSSPLPKSSPSSSSSSSSGSEEEMDIVDSRDKGREGGGA